MARVTNGKTKDEQVKAVAAVSKKQQRKDNNRLANAARAARNAEDVSVMGLPSETVVRNITRISKKGKKTIATIITVEKPKRNSKLIRKHKRAGAKLIADAKFKREQEQLAAAGKPTEAK